MLVTYDKCSNDILDVFAKSLSLLRDLDATAHCGYVTVVVNEAAQGHPSALTTFSMYLPKVCLYSVI